MPPRDPASLQDIARAAHRIAEFVHTLACAEFLDDWRLHNVVIRELEVIGEATKRLTPEVLQQYPEIDWRQMARLRDVLIHRYDVIDLQIVWEVATEDIPVLIERLDPIIARLAPLQDA
jgi:uncharacterized protein with HEPN domain